MKKKHTKKSFRYTGGLQNEAHLFLSNLAVLTAAGMDIVSAIASLEDDTESKRMRRYISEIRNTLENGGELWKAMRHTEIFPKRVVSLIKIGENSGQLVQNLETVVAQLDKENDFKTRIRTAMLYPAIVLPLTFIVGIGVAWFALPKLADMYAQINTDLPTLTVGLIYVGDFFADYGHIFVPMVVFSFIITMYFLFSFPRTKVLGQVLIARMPVFRKLILEVELARVGYVLGNLLSSGIPITDSIVSLKESTTFYTYRKFYTHLYENIEVGNTIKESFDSYPKVTKLIPKPIQNIITTGEKSGILTDTLIKIGEAYEKKVETSRTEL